MLRNEEYSSEYCQFVPFLSWLVAAQHGAWLSPRWSITSSGFCLGWERLLRSPSGMLALSFAPPRLLPGPNGASLLAPQPRQRLGRSSHCDGCDTINPCSCVCPPLPGFPAVMLPDCSQNPPCCLLCARPELSCCPQCSSGFCGSSLGVAVALQSRGVSNLMNLSSASKGHLRHRSFPSGRCFIDI